MKNFILRADIYDFPCIAGWNTFYKKNFITHFMTNIILIFFSQASAVIDLIGFPSYINNHTLLNKEYEDVRFTLSIFFFIGGVGGVTCVLEERG